MNDNKSALSRYLMSVPFIPSGQLVLFQVVFILAMGRGEMMSDLVEVFKVVGAAGGLISAGFLLFSDVQPLFDHDEPGRDYRALSRHQSLRWQPGTDAGRVLIFR